MSGRVAAVAERAGVQSHAAPARPAARPRHACSIDHQQPHHLRCRDWQLSLILNYLTRAPYFLMAAVTTLRDRPFDLGVALQVDRTRLRPPRPVHDHFRRSSDRDPSAVEQGRRRFRAEHPPWPHHKGAFDLRLFLRRDRQRGHVPVRGVFLFVRRDRGGMGPEGPSHKPHHQHCRDGPRLHSSLSQSLANSAQLLGPPMSIPKFRAAPRSRPRSRSASGA